MNFYKYYTEIKNRIILVLLTWVLTSITCYIYKETLLFVILNSSNTSNENISISHFIFTDVTEIFSVYMQIIIFITNQIILVSFVYHTIVFLAPGLYITEYNNLAYFINISIILYILSLVVFNKILLPFGWEFFLSFYKQNNAQHLSLFFESKINEYFQFYKSFYYLCLINSQLSLTILLTINMFSKSIKSIQQFRKIFYFIFILLSTILTPPDVFSQLFISTCLIYIYETFILLKLLNSKQVTN